MKPKIFTLCAALILGASALFASDTVASVQHDNRSRYVRFQSNDLNLTVESQIKSASAMYLVSNTATSLEVNYAQAVYYPSYSTSEAYNWSIDLINLTNSTDYTIGMSIDLNTPTLTSIAGTWTTANGISLTYSSLVFVNGTDTTALAATDVVLTLDYQGQDTDNNPIYAVTATMTCDDDNTYTISNTLVFYCYNAETDETIIINEPINLVDGIYYNFDDANLTATVTYRGSSYNEYTNEYTGDVVIPATVTYGGKTYSVTSIGEDAFFGCSGLTSVTIPNSVTSIGRDAFDVCNGLIQTNYTGDIAGWCGIDFSNYRANPTAFSHNLYLNDVEVKNLVIPDGVVSIGAYAFDNCSNITSVTISNSVTSIGAYAFYGCSGLTSVTIGNSVESIGVEAFYDCSSLTSVLWNAKNFEDFEYSNYAPFYDIASQITSFTFGNEVEHIPAYLCYGMKNLTAITIPNSVTSIGESAFSGCSVLTAVTIPNSVTSISDYVFLGCSGLTSVTLGNSVRSIGTQAFWNCSGLTSITIPNSVISIGNDAFGVCEGLTSVTIGNSVESIGYYAFGDCANLTSIIIPNSVITLGHSVFYRCSGLTSVVIGSSVESIGHSAFYGCSSLTSVTIPNSVTNVGEEAFYGCSNLTAVVWNAKTCEDFSDYSYAPFYDICSQIASFTFGNAVDHIPAYLCLGMENLTAITIPNSVTSIGESAFSGCSEITSISTPNLVKSIEKNTFADCTKLKTVVIGNAVTNIGDGAFYGCNRLLYFTCYAEEPPFVGADPFSTYNAYLKVPCSGLDAYKMYDVWRNFKNISCIGSEEIQVTEFSVTPSVNDAQFTWPAEPNAATYELVISKAGVVFCTLTFNANGQLMGIAFAPSANAPAAAPTTSGFQFTVTGLDAASHYTYTFDAKDAGGNVIKHYAGEFNTEGSTVGLEQIELANIYTQDGLIVCEGEFRIYDLLGRDVTRLNGSLCGVYVVKSGNAAVKVVVK